jgi:predicted secreted Zn-dependent protease
MNRSPNRLKQVLAAIVSCLVVILFHSLTPIQAQSQPVVAIKTVYYPINGATAGQLRQQMNQLGPISQTSGQRFDARTDWYVRWNYQYFSQGNRCKLTAIRVRADVSIILPQWKQSANAAKGLVDRWNQYIKALRLHEDGHKDNGIATSREVLQLLKQFPAKSSCSELGAAANKAAQSIISQYSQRDLDYDRKTQHGVTQGAVFSG